MENPKSLDEELEREAWRERIRQMPGVIVHRRDPSAPLEPFVSDIVVNPWVSIRELTRLDDDDDLDDDGYLVTE
jgi:hypothetical protein